MTKTILAAAAITALMSLSAHAQTPSAAPANPGQRCDRDGCWTYDCDATSNHCHRHWTSSTPRDAATSGNRDTSHPDQLCDSNGDNCADAPR